ncbi:MAG: manganese-dependent inorganic pyrophosphatase [Lactobacillaceae bacterium]|jgi:manganese-dependent inorganic pyrophosphatase|nr:manganese-dependent inorganic pyrophosphatase [Lactobacillaceae bacterium]
MSEYQVFGHTNPDTDTIASAIATSYLLNNLYKWDTQAVALGTPNEETTFALNYFKVQAPNVIKEAETEKVVLVDHNEAAQSVTNLSDVTVASIYDHHKFNFSNSDPLYIVAKPWGSVATILYFEFKNNNVEIPSEIAGLMASAIISDTLLLKSPTTTDVDKIALEELAKVAGLENYKEYGLELLKAGTNLENKTEEELLNGDAKTFTMSGRTIRIGQVNTVDIDSVLSRKDKLLAAMDKQMQKNGFDDFLFVITDILNSNSKAIFQGEDLAFVEEAFSIKADNHIIDLPGVVSRKKQVVPPLEESFK